MEYSTRSTAPCLPLQAGQAAVERNEEAPPPVICNLYYTAFQDTLYFSYNRPKQPHPVLELSNFTTGTSADTTKKAPV